METEKNKVESKKWIKKGKRNKIEIGNRIKKKNKKKERKNEK
jgi:hypothetical protein